MRVQLVNSLQGLHLLVTRPADQAHVWGRQLRELGAAVTIQPMLVIEPLKDKDSAARITNVIRQVDQFQKIIFISQNAVVYGIEWLKKYWLRLPVNIECFAIGASTAVLLESRGVAVQSAGATMDSEALLKLTAMQNIHGQKILIFRGCGGRNYLASKLSERGAWVEYCDLYRRKPPLPSVQVLPSAFYKTTGLTPITTVHSGEALTNLVKAVPSSQLVWLRQQPLLLPGERVAAIGNEMGFAELLIAKNATHKGMTEALYEWRQRQY